MHVNGSVFKAYDIRGIVGTTIDAAFAEHLGRAFGSAAIAAGERAVAVGRDGRHSGPEWRPSRPTATPLSPAARASLPKARPRCSAKRSSIVLATIPRMS